MDTFPPSTESAASPEDLRNAMRLWATGVTIVSSRHGEVQHGMTVNSFTSISLEPPLLMVSLGGETRTCALVQQSGVFGVTILNQEQQALSERFAGHADADEDRFQGLDTFSLASGAPFISGGLAYLDCRVVAAYEVGDHVLFIGQVTSLRTGTDGAPLVYFDRGYRQLHSPGPRKPRP